MDKTDYNLNVAQKENASILLEEDYSEHYDNFNPNSPESYIALSLTQDAYNNICIKKTEYNIKDILENESIDNWKKYIKNAFESYAINKINELKKIKTHLYKLGAKYVSLTGSGSCMYGIFEEKDIIKEDIKYDYYLVRPLIRSDSNR